jgi:hypothetical protein
MAVAPGSKHERLEGRPIPEYALINAGGHHGDVIRPMTRAAGTVSCDVAVEVPPWGPRHPVLAG